MAKHLPVPPDLEHLIEKREGEKDRRSQDRRKSAAEVPNAVERRRQTDRRGKRRRKTGG